MSTETGQAHGPGLLNTKRPVTRDPTEAVTGVGLADAWDTITSDRGYAPALSLGDALAEIRAGRGKQFSPRVVHALWEVAKQRPADVLLSAEPAATGIVG